MYRIQTVFLSSTFEDLKAHRAAVMKAVNELVEYKYDGMEVFGARTPLSDELCREQVGRCDIFVAVIGHLYGSIPPGCDQSYTEREYEAAKQAGKHILVFLARDEIAPLGAAVQSDDHANRQKAFRKFLSDRPVGDFTTPEELALGVLQALHNLRPPGTLDQLGRQPYRTGPHLGPLVAKLCDRQNQESQFTESFRTNLKARPAKPLVCVLRGDRDECHESLVERLCQTILTAFARQQWGDSESLVSHLTVPWPFDAESVPERWTDLQTSLFKQLDPTLAALLGPLTPEAFVDVCGRLRGRVVVIQHGIPAELWDGLTAALMDKYLDFWDAIGRQEARPHVVVFLNLQYPTGRRATRKKENAKASVAKIAEARAVAAVERTTGAPCVLLNELQSVRRHDVTDWFSQHNILEDPLERDRRADQLFKDETKGTAVDSRPMAFIESELLKLLRERTSARGPW